MWVSTDAECNRAHTVPVCGLRWARAKSTNGSPSANLSVGGHSDAIISDRQLLGLDIDTTKVFSKVLDPDPLAPLAPLPDLPSLTKSLKSYFSYSVAAISVNQTDEQDTLCTQTVIDDAAIGLGERGKDELGRDGIHHIIRAQAVVCGHIEEVVIKTNHEEDIVVVQSVASTVPAVVRIAIIEDTLSMWRLRTSTS